MKIMMEHSGAQSADALLTVNNLTKQFGGLTAVSDLSFRVNRGEVLSLVGPNGAGKTTTFNCVAGFLRQDIGRILFDGGDITHLSPDKRAKIGIARTFQNIRLFPTLNAVENVMVGWTGQGRSGVLDSLFCLPRDRRDRREARERAEELLDWVGVRRGRLNFPAEMPYGDQRRVEIARALATAPRMLILDEPTAGMVAQEAHGVIDLMGQLTESGLTLMLVEHNMNVVMSASDRIVVLNFGQKIAEGTPREIQRDPKVIEAYLGSDD